MKVMYIVHQEQPNCTWVKPDCRVLHRQNQGTGIVDARIPVSCNGGARMDAKTSWDEVYGTTVHESWVGLLI